MTQRSESSLIEIEETCIRNTLVPRKKDAHKGDFGKMLIFAGSPGMAGAAVLCGRSALKSGAGLVQFLLPDFHSVLLPILQTAVPEATCVEMQPAFPFSSYAAIAAGSGLGQSPTAEKILTQILEEYTGTLVLDADALNLIALHEDLAEKTRTCKAAVILTPHVGEARRLLHTDAPMRDLDSRIESVLALAETYRCTAILKGAGTLVAQSASLHSPEDAAVPVYRNTTGNPGMATAGSGDTLAGLIGSLAAQGYQAVQSACMGVFLHGLAGDLAAKKTGEMGLTSSDIAAHIPCALHMFNT